MLFFAAMRRSLMLLLMILLLPLASEAGPPLIGDDPHAIGGGNVEVIVAAGGFGIFDADELSVPIVDLAFGLVDGLDATLIGEPIFIWPDEGHSERSGVVVPGFKWQFLRDENWNAAFSPAVVIPPSETELTTVALPVQLEYARGPARVGVDAGYSVVVDETHLWHAVLYGGYEATDSLHLLGELWWDRSPADLEPEVGFSLGFDWLPAPGIHLLAAGGTGIASFGGERVRWHAFAGLQWDIEDAWSH